MPPGENLEEWKEAFALADLQVGGSTSNGVVDVVVSGTNWQVVVHDATGAVRSATVAAPRTESQREDTALLMASLLRPIAARPPVVAGPVAPPVPAPKPAPAPRPKPTPAATPVTPVEAPVVDATPAVVPVEPPPAFKIHPALSLGVSGEYRPGLNPTAAARVGAGVVVIPGLLVGFVGDAVAPADVVLVGHNTSVAAWGAGGAVTYAAEGKLCTTAGIEAGVRWARFMQDDADLSTVTYPWAALVVGTNHPIASNWSVSPSLRLSGDLRTTGITAADGTRATLAAWSARISFAAQWGDFR